MTPRLLAPGLARLASRGTMPMSLLRPRLCTALDSMDASEDRGMSVEPMPHESTTSCI